MHFAFTLQGKSAFLLQSVTGHEKQTKRAPEYVRMLFEADVMNLCAIFRSVGFRVENRHNALFAPCLDATQGLVGLFVSAEGCKANVALAGRSEANTWGADDVGAIEQGLKEFP